MHLRDPRPDELPALSALCLRAKAVWGYDAAFLTAVTAELTLTTRDLHTTAIAVAEVGDDVVGVVQVSRDESGTYLEKLFVDPARHGEGAGRRLYRWALGAARGLGSTALVIESDPGAAPFYRRMGATPAGTAPSGSIPGRTLPRLVHRLATHSRSR